MSIAKALFPWCLFLFLSGVFTGLYYAAEEALTRYRRKKNQEAWDEFGKGMSDAERADVFLDWLEKRQKETGWKHLYIPKIKNGDEDHV